LELLANPKGIHIYTRSRKTVAAGERIKLSARIKGKGQAMLGLYLYASSGKWIGQNMYESFEAGDRSRK
jgi:hypothetical protein